jgi:EAL domain-containing protein (putative c-di-GMP-specific phosphodiesterase class I)
MYAAKGGDATVCVYDASLDPNSADRLALVTAFRQALDKGELVVHVQPKADLHTGTIEGVEALVRWQHPERGLLGPDQFLPIAERAGLMRRLTSIVLDDGLAACARWRAQGHHIGLAINLSARTLVDDDFVGEVERGLRRHGLSPSCLTLEITEGSVMTDPSRAITLMSELAAMGVRISVDDFGTGYSSLSYLRRLPVHELKIDRSFVTGMAESADSETIVQSIIDLGTNLSLGVVAEGVEDRQTWDRLAQMGCHLGQGYLLSRPLPVDQFISWLAARQKVAGSTTVVDLLARRAPSPSQVLLGLETPAIVPSTDLTSVAT